MTLNTSHSPAALKQIAALRSQADTLTRLIDGKMNPATANQNPTRRRLQMLAQMRREGERMLRQQHGLRAIADALETDTCPPALFQVRSKQVVASLLDLASDGAGGGYCMMGYRPADIMDKSGIRDDKSFQQARRDLEGLIAGVVPTVDPVERRIADAERGLFGVKIPGFFPTPRELADRVIRLAAIDDGHMVLEPSAGSGNLADAVRRAHGDKVTVHCVEPSATLRDILELKGHTLVGRDTMNVASAGYDRIVMNPPFEKGADIDHVRHAYYEQLKPGGRLVAIMGAGSFFRNDRKATGFREWMNKVQGESEELPEGSFKESGTNVNAFLVMIDRPRYRQD